MKLIGVVAVLLVIAALIAETRMGGRAPAAAECAHPRPYQKDDGPLRLQASCSTP